MSERVQLNVRVPRTTKEWLHAEAEEQGVGIGRYVNELLDWFQPPPPSPPRSPPEPVTSPLQMPELLHALCSGADQHWRLRSGQRCPVCGGQP